MKLVFKNILVLIFFTILSISCVEKDKKRIVFYCLYCKGCVERNLNYIAEHNLDKEYDVVMDTTCFSHFNAIRSIKYRHLDQKEIEKTYGDYANILLIDSTGKQTIFNTDMNLKDYIK